MIKKFNEMCSTSFKKTAPQKLEAHERDADIAASNKFVNKACFSNDILIGN